MPFHRAIATDTSLIRPSSITSHYQFKFKLKKKSSEHLFWQEKMIKTVMQDGDRPANKCAECAYQKPNYEDKIENTDKK